MQPLFLLPDFSVADDPLNLGFHSLHGIRSTIPASLAETKADATTRPKFEDTLILDLQTHARPHDGTIDLGVEIISIGILRNEL
jgi:hypothetical protein